MNTQNRIYVTLSPRIRTALNVCATLDGSTSATYAASLLSAALLQEIEKRPALREHWSELEREALRKGSWIFDNLNEIDDSNENATVKRVYSWFIAGKCPQDYVYGKDDRVIYEGKKTSYLKAKETASTAKHDFGTLMQKVSADNYRNKRVRFSTVVKSEEVQNWAGLWMRVDGAESEPMLGFYNMQDRPIKGTTDWQKYEVVLDVPEESTYICFGFLLLGHGQLWFSEPQLEVVGKDVPTHTMPTVNPDWKEENDAR